MPNSLTRVPQFLIAATFALALAALSGPLLASANSLATSESSALALTRNDATLARQIVTDKVKRCMEADSEKGDHHDKESFAEQAKKWERAAGKHAKAGDHEQAASAYEYAACLRLKAAQLEAAADDYDKAAEQWDAAGDEAKARDARKDAKSIRDSMK